MNDDLKYSEIPEELINSLCKTFKTIKNSAINDCAMSEMAISYASGELEDNQEFRDHLQICRYCLDLVLDIHEAESESQIRSSKSVEVLPALSEAIGYSKRFVFLKKIPSFISKQIAPLKSPKFIAPLATACLLVVILTISFNNPKTFEMYKETVKKIKPLKKVTAQQSNPEQRSKSINEPGKGTPSIQLITPIDQGKIDPLAPSIGDNATSVLAKKKRKNHVPRSPLEHFDLSQLKLVGVIISSNRNIALVEDFSGKGYVVEKGTHIGLNSGKVIQVMEDRVIIEEKTEDISGTIISRREELELQNRIKE